jgi:hypothetical protein
MDQRVSNYTVSVWADPDIGDAVFYIVLETPADVHSEEAPNVSMWIEPVSGRLSPVTYEATRQDLRHRVQFEAKPYFDQGDIWNVGIRIETVGGKAGELVTEVESTPPGYGPWDLAIYSFPFLMLGGMWIVAMVRRSRARRDRRHEPATPQLGKSPC